MGRGYRPAVSETRAQSGRSAMWRVHEAWARRVLGGDLRSKCAFTGFLDPASRAPCLFVAGALPL